MTPNKLLEVLRHRLGRHGWNVVEQCANELLETLQQRRSPPPLTVGPRSLGPCWHQSVATFVCYAAISRVRDARKRQRRKPTFVRKHR